VLESRDLVIGDYIVGRVTGKATLGLGYPVLDEAGEVRAVLYAGLDLDRLNKIAAKTRLPTGTTLTVIDRKGTILVRFPDPEKWVGKSMPETPLFQTILHQGEGTAELPGMDGVPRLYGFTRLGKTGDAYVSVGIPKEVAFAPANHLLTRNLIALGIVAVLALVAAWFGADLFVLRRVNDLVSTTKRLTAGDLRARTELRYGKGELSELARTFDTMAASMEQLITERKQAEQRLTSLHEINIAITSSLDLHAVLNVLMEKIDFFLPYTAVLVWLRNRETGLLERAACWNLDEEDWKGRKLASTPSLVKAAMESKVPVVASNVQTDPRTLDPDLYRRHGLVSYLGVPLLTKGEVLGVLVFLTREEHKFTNEEIEFLSTLAGQAAIAIHNSQLYEETQTREAQLQETTRMLSALYSVATAASQSLDLDQVLQAAIEKIRGIFGFDATRIHIYDERTDELLLKTALESDPDRFTQARSFKKGKGIVGKVAESGKALIFEDIQTDTLYQQVSQLKFLPAFGYHFLAVFPIKGRLKNLGTLTCIGAPPRKLSSGELQLLEALLDQIAVAIENSGLYEEVRKRVQELQQKTTEVERANDDLKRQEEIQKLLKELSQDITSLDIDSLLNKLTEKVREFFKVDISDVRVIEKEGMRNVGVSGIEPERLQTGHAGMGRWRWFLENRRPLLIPDITQWTEFSTVGKVTRGLGVRSYLAVPLISRGGEVLGILRALTYQPREFTQEEVDLLQQMANGAAIALENAQLLEHITTQAVELEKANKVKDEFLGFVSHELRTPLNAVIAYTLMMQDKLMGEVNAEQEKTLEKVSGYSKDLLAMINSLLEVTRIEAGRVEVENHKVSLDRLLEDLRSMYDVPTGKPLTLEWEYPSDLPMVKTDSGKLRHILENLINNAIKFTAKGSVKISACSCPESKNIELKVADTGIGIPKDSLPVIFEMFRQVDGSQDQPSGGIGLGLHIVKKFTEMLGGKIEVESELGRGSIFTVTIPCGNNL